MTKRPRHWTYHEERIRKQVLVRDNYECQIRYDARCLGTANTVDHIHPKAWGGRATADNLRAACKPCNQAKGARSAVVAATAGGNPFFRSSGYRTAPLQNPSPLTSPWAIESVRMTVEADET